MFDNPDFNGLLVLPRIHVQNVNAISSPFTWGFPSMTAFLGLMWALERKLLREKPDLKDKMMLTSVGVVCHRFSPQVSDESYIRRFSLTRNPLDKDGKPSILEEGKAHIVVSIVFGVNVLPDILISKAERDRLSYDVWETMMSMRIAGGSVIPGARFPILEVVPDDDDLENRRMSFMKLRKRLLPGFALVSRESLLHEHFQKMKKENPMATLLDAWLDLSRNNIFAERKISQTNEGIQESVEWTSSRKKGGGWVVPIPVGYTSLTEIFSGGSVSNTRDEKTSVRFVESAYSIGEWVGPHRLSDARDFLWHGHYDETIGVYRCVNNYQSKGDIDA